MKDCNVVQIIQRFFKGIILCIEVMLQYLAHLIIKAAADKDLTGAKETHSCKLSIYL